MRAVRFHEYGGADVLRVDEVPEPRPGPGEALVRVRACALNHVDVDMRNGTSRLPISLPHTLGFELAGEVAALGEGVTEVTVGDRVSPLYQIHCRECEWCLAGEHYHCERISMLGVTAPGGYADHVVAPAWALVRLPDSLSYVDATGVQTTFGTVWHALVDRAPVKEGDVVLVNAAGSGVGSAAIQVARRLGARVIASAGAAFKLERALADGAEAAVDYRSEDLAARVRELTGGRGVDVVMESVGGEVLEASLAALAKNGRVVTVGAHAGEIVAIDAIRLFRNQWSLVGSVRATADELRHVIELAGRGELRPAIHEVFPLEQAADAHEVMEERRQYGKIVLQP